MELPLALLTPGASHLTEERREMAARIAEKRAAEEDRL